jgi:hypothetical protein
MAIDNLTRKCSIEHCEKKHKSRGWCDKHYYRWRVNGSPLSISRRENVAFSDVSEVDFAVRFWSLATLTADATRCWLWGHTTTKAGYGQVQIAHSRHYAHRIAWQLANGRPANASLEILHSCDTPQCVNPEHLQEGTHADNLNEASARDRMQKGADRHNTSLTDETVREIRQALANGKTGQWVSQTYNIAPMTVSKIKHRQTWKHVI